MYCENIALKYGYDYVRKAYWATFVKPDGRKFGYMNPDKTEFFAYLEYQNKISERELKRFQENWSNQILQESLFSTPMINPYTGTNFMKEQYVLSSYADLVFLEPAPLYPFQNGVPYKEPYVSPAWQEPVPQAVIHKEAKYCYCNAYSEKHLHTENDTYMYTPEPAKSGHELYIEHYWKFVNSKNLYDMATAKAEMLQYVTEHMEPEQDDSWVADPITEIRDISSVLCNWQQKDWLGPFCILAILIGTLIILAAHGVL